MTGKKPTKPAEPTPGEDELPGATPGFLEAQALHLTGDLTEGALRPSGTESAGPGADEYGLPLSMQELAARDPFTEEYIQFRSGQAKKRREREQEVDVNIRADLLKNPHFMEKPAESGNRGAVAAWRSLRDQLKGESTALMDSSGLADLQMLRRELFTRRTLIEAVKMGLDMQLKRLDDRIKLAAEEEEAARLKKAEEARKAEKAKRAKRARSARKTKSAKKAGPKPGAKKRD